MTLLCLFAAFVIHPLGLAAMLAFLGVVGTIVNFGAYNQDAAAQTVVQCSSQQNTDAVVGAHTLVAGVLGGFDTNYLFVTAAGGVNVTTRTAAQIYADAAAALGFNPPTNFIQEFIVVNTGGGTVTLVGGTGVTISGTATIANNAVRTYTVLIASPSSVTITNVGSGSV